MSNNYSDLPKTVRQIGTLHLEGNIIPNQWYHQIKLESGRTDTQAILILAEIIYWYRPLIERDEETGQNIVRKKFKHDKLQHSIQYYMDKFGFTNNQVRKALNRLVEYGFIKKELRNIKINGVMCSNILFIEPIYDAIYKITYPNKSNDILKITQKLEGPAYIPDPPSYKTDPPSYKTDPPSYKTDPPSYKTDVNKDYNIDYNKDYDDRQIQGDGSLAKTEPKNPQNLSSSSLILNFNFDDFKWPQLLTKNEANIKILARLPDNHNRQQVLDVFQRESTKTGIKVTEGALLNGLVNKQLEGTLDPIPQKQTKADKNKQAIDRQKKIDQCPFCNKEGLIEFKHNDGSISNNPNCAHPPKINWDSLRAVGVIEITSAKEGYKYDLKPDKKCPYCNHKGILTLKDSAGDLWNFKCNHNKRSILSMEMSQTGFNYIEIVTAKDGYKNLTDQQRSKTQPVNFNNFLNDYYNSGNVNNDDVPF